MVSQHALHVVSHHALQQVSRGGVVSQHALQVFRPTPWGEVEGSGQGGSPGPYPRGKLRGLAWGLQAHNGGGSPGPHSGEGVSRPTPGGVSRCTPGVWSPGPHPGGCIPAYTEATAHTATAAVGTHRTGMHSNFKYFYLLNNSIVEMKKRLSRGVISILCANFFKKKFYHDVTLCVL